MGNWVEGTGANLEEAAAGGEADGEPKAESAADGVWWEMVCSDTVEGAGRAIQLDGAFQTFAETVEVAGALGDGQLAKQLEDLGGQQGWRLGLVRLSAGAVAPVVSAVCVVSEARPKRGRVFRMMALAVDEGMRGQGLASVRGDGETEGRAAPGGWAEVRAEG